MNKIPKVFLGSNICIICEGDEEYEYMEKLKSLDVWSDKYRIDPKNAHGNGNIFARYQDKYQNDSYDLVLIFCDTDKKPFEQYNDIKNKINEFHGNDDAADLIIIFGNPCTMQIVLGHWDSVILRTHKKRENAPIIERITGVCGYKAREDQRREIFSKIDKENYEEMKERVTKLPDDDTIVGSTNFDRFLEAFSQDNTTWIDEINKKLEG